MKDYYKILQIDPDASLDVLNNAYRTLVRQYHPDLYHTSRKDCMNAKMQEINEAYNTLNNATSRAEYDRRYTAWRQGKQRQHAMATSLQALNIKSLVLWFVGSFVVFRFLLKPFMASPWVKILLLVGLAYLMVRLYTSRQKPSA